jgi:hypothetical protein
MRPVGYLSTYRVAVQHGYRVLLRVRHAVGVETFEGESEIPGDARNAVDQSALDGA